MTVVVDTSFVLAVLRADDANHAAATGWLTTLGEDLWTSPLAVAEMDHWASRLGAAEEFRQDLDSGAYNVRWWADALRETIGIARLRPDIGLTDASLVAVAGRLGTDRIATFDHHHFRSLTTAAGKPFVLLPADA
ncbi:type II toxin-antitoxin system VapC family toxin [Paraconexibacter sp.]|uniref:type II toxin-antitoxin system VapC family toxin n=1 Tax=Paraconexibacter sp. TaxID=2949640 RepID=UPI003566B04E